MYFPKFYLLLTYYGIYIGEYIRSKGKVYISSDGYKYFSSKAVGSRIHLRCTLFRNSCKGTAKLDLEENVLYLKSVHNHHLENYKSGISALKTKCKRSAQCLSDGLRHVFNEVTRSDSSASDISFNEIESAMFRSRRMLQPSTHQKVRRITNFPIWQLKDISFSNQFCIQRSIGADVGILGGFTGGGNYWGIFGSDFFPLEASYYQWNELSAKDPQYPPVKPQWTPQSPPAFLPGRGRTAWEFCEILPTSRKFAKNLKAIVMLENKKG